MDFTCTACRRPGIFWDTLDSFRENLRGVDFKASRLHLNIDPLPAAGDVADVIKVAFGTFGEVFANAPQTACFPAAVRRCWLQPEGERFFHLEDDWLLQKPVDIREMMAFLDADPSLSLVNLRAYSHSDDRLCLAPGLWRTAHARAIAEKMRTDANPEMQLRAQRPNNPHGGLHVGYKGMQYPKEIVIRDIGRPWMVVNGLQREGVGGGKRHFVKWK